VKLVLAGPVPPVRSGIADFVTELLPHLASRSEVTLLVDGIEPDLRTKRSGATILDGRDRRAGAVIDEADVVLVQMGNDPLHEWAYELILARASAGRPVVGELHDVVLAHFAAALWLEKGKSDRFLEEARIGHGEPGLRIAREEILGRGLPLWDLDPWRLPMSGRLIRSVAGLVVHSRFARRKVWANRPELPVAVIPHFALPPSMFPDREAARRRIGIPSGRFVVTSTGFAVPSKRIDASLEALAAWRDDSEWEFRIAGEAVAGEPLRRLSEALRIADRCVFTGYLPAAALLDEMAATDLLVNLREPTFGESSGSVARILSSGVAVAVSDVGWYSEIPDNAVYKVPTGSGTVPALRRLFGEVRAHPDQRRKTGETAAAFSNLEWGIEKVAAEYLSELPRLAAGPAPVDRLQSQVALAFSSLGTCEIDPRVGKEFARALRFASGDDPRGER